VESNKDGGAKSVVITGSTRGIGFGMAEEFLRRGHRVMLCGRNAERTAAAVASLAAKYGGQRVLGLSCDVGCYEQVQNVWDVAAASFGRIDIWINNAGLNTPRRPLVDLPVETIDDVVHTNLLGVMYGSRVALRGMIEQGHGQIYNMEGLGSNGMVFPGQLPYCATKSALTIFTKGLVKETRNTPVRVGFLSPGMVVTNLLTSGIDPASKARPRRRFDVLNVLVDRVETVAPYLVTNILANDRHGAHIEWLTRRKIAWRFLTAPIARRDPFNLKSSHAYR
jgi:NAD(P)-dependent dehydrogenase (short-subunit alcohol dehydrogenase family)